MNRVRFSMRAKEGVIADQSNICPLCDCELSGAIEWDHKIPLALGGMDEIENIQAVHADCHLHLKTKDDVKRIAKAKRMAGETGQYARRKRKGPQIKSRGWDKTLRRKMNGTIEVRSPSSE